MILFYIYSIHKNVLDENPKQIPKNPHIGANIVPNDTGLPRIVTENCFWDCLRGECLRGLAKL
jgi:hypothetical protein